MNMKELKARLLTTLIVVERLQGDAKMEMLFQLIIDTLTLCIEQLKEYQRNGATAQDLASIDNSFEKTRAAGMKLAEMKMNNPRMEKLSEEFNSNGFEACTRYVTIRKEFVKTLNEQEAASRPVTQNEVDTLLDKILTQGMDALTEEERKRLDRYADQA